MIHKLLVKGHILCVMLLFSLPSFGEEFYSFYLNQLDSKHQRDVIFICTDSLTSGENVASTRTVSQYQFKQKKYSTNIYQKRNEHWKLIKSNVTNTPSTLDHTFVEFLNQFSANKDYQINHTIFPLPVSMVEKPGTLKKKLVMPRDWEIKEITTLYPSMQIIHSNKEENNRKIYVFRNGKINTLFNFIYINKQWYLIEMEVYS